MLFSHVLHNRDLIRLDLGTFSLHVPLVAGSFAVALCTGVDAGCIIYLHGIAPSLLPMTSADFPRMRRATARLSHGSDRVAFPRL